MQSHADLPYFHIKFLSMKWASFLKFTVYIVKIDKKQNPFKIILVCYNVLVFDTWVGLWKDGGGG